MGPLARTFLRFLPFLIIPVAATCFVPSARADSVQFSFRVDPVGCVFFGAGACSDPTAGSGIFSVTSVNPGQACFTNSTFYEITSVVGQINGHDMSFVPKGPCDNLLSLTGFPAPQSGGTSDYFAANNQQWAFLFSDMGPTRYNLENFNTNTFLPITWSAQVLVPEPSTLISLAIGLLILLLVFKREIRWRRSGF